MESSEDFTETDEEEVPSDMKAFITPTLAEPHHPILSSPFARHIAVAAAGLSKPVWYKRLHRVDFRLLKELFSIIDTDRGKSVNIDDMVLILKELDGSITHEEVISVLEYLDRDNSGEVDFGEFLYVLANSSHYQKMLRSDPSLKRFQERWTFTPRQRLWYSALADYVLSQCPSDIERYYTEKTRRKGDVLKYHMICARMYGLSEFELEDKQLEARWHGRKLECLVDSPYIRHLDFIPAFKRDPRYAEYLKLKQMREAQIPECQKPIPVKRPITPIKPERELGDPVRYKSHEDWLYHMFRLAKLPVPEMKIPAKKLQQMRTRVHEDSKPYIKSLVEKGMTEYENTVKNAVVIHSWRHWDKQSKYGFASDSLKRRFFNVFHTYSPLKREEAMVRYPYTPPTMWVNKPNPKSLRPPFGRAEK